MDQLLKQQLVHKIDFNSRLDESGTSKSLILISSIIAGLLVMLLAFIIGIVCIIVRMKRKCSNYDSNNPLALTHNFLKSGHRSATILSTKKFKSNRKKSDKKLKFEFEKIRKQMDQLEVNVRTKCAHLFQQLHQDYVNDF